MLHTIYTVGQKRKPVVAITLYTCQPTFINFGTCTAVHYRILATGRYITSQPNTVYVKCFVSFIFLFLLFVPPCEESCAILYYLGCFTKLIYMLTCYFKLS